MTDKFVCHIRPCTQCGEELYAWYYDGNYSHCGGQHQSAGPWPGGGFLCEACARERYATVEMMLSLGRLTGVAGAR